MFILGPCFLSLMFQKFVSFILCYIYLGEYTSPAYGPLTPTTNEYLKELYDKQYDCKYYGKSCEDKRRKAEEYTENYYNQATEQETKTYKDKCGNYATGISYVDTRPLGHDRYIDYSTGYTTPTRPSHGHYGRLPYTNVRDPTCKELQHVVVDMCSCSEGGNGNDEYGMGKICGFGTTWNPEQKQCIGVPDEYTAIEGTGQPYSRPVYPYIRPTDDTTCYDDPNDNYAYLTPHQQQVFNSCPHGTNNCTPTYPDGTCNANRCRFPLTSTQGQEQAKLYVTFFRQVYEYVGGDVNKVTRRTRIRNLIDNHWTFFGSGLHNNGAFLPWHRWYILEMETILLQHQAETATTSGCDNTFVGIPYFDWHNLKNNQTPKEFINNDNDVLGHHFHNSLGQNTAPPSGCISQGGLAGFLLTDGTCLSRSWSMLVGEETPETTLHPLFPLSTQYNLFRNRLEAGPGLHNMMHCVIGATMCSARAANDPIFFTHHANIDKIWYDWQMQSAAHLTAYSGSTPLGSLMPASTASPSDMLDLNNQLYTPPLGGTPVTLSVEYVDMDTSSMWGNGDTKSI